MKGSEKPLPSGRGSLPTRLLGLHSQTVVAAFSAFVGPNRISRVAPHANFGGEQPFSASLNFAIFLTSIPELSVLHWVSYLLHLTQ